MHFTTSNGSRHTASRIRNECALALCPPTSCIMSTDADVEFAHPLRQALGIDIPLIEPRTILALETEELRRIVSQCRTFGERLNDQWIHLEDAACDRLYALPEAFFTEDIIVEGGSIRSRFMPTCSMDHAAEALRRVVHVGVRGKGLARATRDFLRMHCDPADEMHFSEQDHWRSGLGFLFIAMCQAAKAEGRQEEIRLAFQRNNLIRLACLASDPAVQGIRLVGLHLDTDHTDRIALRRAWNKEMRELSSTWSDSESSNFGVDAWD